MKTLKLALDWTPNTNHTGFFVAHALGYYQELDLSLEIQSVEQDNYQLTPAKKVELGQADLALCPSESLLSYQTKSEPLDLVGIGAIFQKDASAIVTLKTSTLDRPAKLDGKRYASYKARYEDQIVRQMIINDGGKGDIRISYPEKLGIWDTLLQSNGDATWVFMNWEGILAEGDGIKLYAHYLSDYKIPYGYSPVIAGARSVIEKSPDTYRDFLAATKKGFQFCQKHPEQAAELLRPHLSTADAKIDLIKSQQSANQYYGMENWGILDLEVLDTFLDWLRVHSLDDSKLTASDLTIDLN